jgi:hypothetical protein
MAPSDPRIDPRSDPAALIDSWDPVDDQTEPAERQSVRWNWHGSPSWGRRLVSAYPVVAVAVALCLVAVTMVMAQGAISQVRSVLGTGGASLLSVAPASGSATAAAGPLTDYQAVTFTRASGTVRPIEGSASLALPPYAGWEANGSAGAANSVVAASGGLLHVGIRRATPGFQGWFLTTTGTVPDSCVFQFAAASPPAVASKTPGAMGELVMAVQTGNTVTTGDINYVLAAENVSAEGKRTLVVGYSLGHLSRATEHRLKVAPWQPGPLHVAIETNGDNRLAVWVNGSLFYASDSLDLGIQPPLQPYLEVQARRTAYSVAYDGYSSVCQPNVEISGLPSGTVAELAGQRATAKRGSVVLTASTVAPPRSGSLTLAVPGARLVTFAPHTYWPGDRFSYAPGG